MTAGGGRALPLGHQEAQSMCTKKKTFVKSLLQLMKYLQKKCGNSCELSIGHQTLLAIAVATGFIIKSHNQQCSVYCRRLGGEGQYQICTTSHINSGNWNRPCCKRHRNHKSYLELAVR